MLSKEECPPTLASQKASVCKSCTSTLTYLHPVNSSFFQQLVCNFVKSVLQSLGQSTLMMTFIWVMYREVRSRCSKLIKKWGYSLHFLSSALKFFNPPQNPSVRPLYAVSWLGQNRFYSRTPAWISNTPKRRRNLGPTGQEFNGSPNSIYSSIRWLVPHGYQSTPW